VARLSSLSRKRAQTLELIRPLNPRDAERLRYLHAKMGMPYEFPDMSDRNFVVTCGLEDSEHQIQAAAAIRTTAEAYLFLNPEWGAPADRWINVLALHESIRVGAKILGLSDVHAFLPPNMSNGFKRRLEGLGWVREPYEPWVRSTNGDTWPEA